MGKIFQILLAVIGISVGYAYTLSHRQNRNLSQFPMQSTI